VKHAQIHVSRSILQNFFVRSIEITAYLLPLQRAFLWRAIQATTFAA